MPRSPEEGHGRSAKGHGVVCPKGPPNSHDDHNFPH